MKAEIQIKQKIWLENIL